MFNEQRNAIPYEKKKPSISNEQKNIVTLGRALLRTSKLLLIDGTLAALNFERQQI